MILLVKKGKTPPKFSIGQFPAEERLDEAEVRISECCEEVAPEHDEERDYICIEFLVPKFIGCPILSGGGRDRSWAQLERRKPRDAEKTPGAGIDGLFDDRDRGYYYDYGYYY